MNRQQTPLDKAAHSPYFNLVPVQLKNLRLYNFRSYPELSVGFSAPFTVIHGANGAGKTNLLEAISLLAPGKGLRGAALDELGHHGAGEWSVISEAGGYKITTGMECGNAKRIAKVDDEKQKGTSTLAEYVSCIWLTPQMDGIFIESNSERRRFFDRVIYNFDPEHASRVAVYENAMRERMKLLKDGNFDQTWLKVLEKRMAEYGTAIAAARNEVIHYLQEELNKSATLFPRPEIHVDGRYENLLHEMKALEVEDIFTRELFDSRNDDRRSLRTGRGVHKTDFKVTNTNKNMPANLCSTGEQKALLLSIILSLAKLLRTRKNKTPIVLLDEVIAHLDENRRRELYAEITALGCQSFLTGTEEELFSGIDAEFLEVRNEEVGTSEFRNFGTSDATPLSSPLIGGRISAPSPMRIGSG